MAPVGAADELARLRGECARLRAETSELKSVLGSMFGALVVVDAAAVIRSVNQATTAMLGYSEADLIGQPLSLIVAVPAPRPGHDVLMSILDLVQDQCYRTKDGRLVPVLLSSTLLIRDSGEVGGAVCVALDVTDTRRLEGDLRQAQKLEALGTLAAGIAHEINTPIQYVGDSAHFLIDAFGVFHQLFVRYRGLGALVTAGDAEGARREVAELQAFEEREDVDYLDEEAPRACARCNEGVRRVARIVGAMKEFAHPGRREKAPADINRALDNTLEVARNAYKLVAAVEREFQLLPPVICDIGDLNQVFLNLVVNAAHAIEDVVGDSGNKGSIRISTRHDEERVFVEIADSGGGIPPHIRDKIFDPFFTTKAVGRGSGQGLSIARNIVVDKHGGALTFTSEVGVGTTFTIALPIGSGLQEPAPSAEEPS
jgi:PAS domain S-box-containing protein